jgi:hypothetical protein
MTAIPPDAVPHVERAPLKPIALPSTDDRSWAGMGRVTTTRYRSPSCALDLSKSRTHDAALEIFKAYKLSGNFHSNLEAVLKDMGVFEMVMYRVEPNPALAFPDCRHVVLTLNDNVPGGKLDGIINSIKARIGFEAPWWGRMLRRLQSGTAGATPMCRTYY